MEPHELTPVVESLLFASQQPITLNAIVKAIDDESVDRQRVKAVIDALGEHYDHSGRGFELVRLGNSYQILTRSRFSPWIENLLTTRRRARLSRAGLETIAVIAYKQPLSRMEIERIRGVDAGGVLNTLMERGLIMIKGRDPGPGRALLYGTTQAFLEYFGLSKVSDLPQLDELAALAGVAPGQWTDAEQARFEKYGVDLDSVPTPEALLHAGPEEPEQYADEPDATTLESIPETLEETHLLQDETEPVESDEAALPDSPV